MTSSLNHPEVIFIGIAGPTCCGKTTYAKHLIDHLHSPLYPIGLDDFYIRGIPINHPKLGRINSEEEPETLDIKGLLTVLHGIKNEPMKLTRYHRKDISINDNNKYIFVIVEGFILFALSNELTNMFDIRIFFESTQSQCRMRRYRRQYQIEENIPDDQIQIPERFQQWFDYLVWDEYLNQRDLQTTKCDKIFHSDEYHNQQYTNLDNYIDKRLKDILEQKNK